MTLFDFSDLLIHKSWSRPVKEVKAYRVIESESGYKIIFNALGVDKEDIEVKLLQNNLYVRGKTEDDDIEFTNSVNYQLNVSNLTHKIEKIEYQLKNGLLVVHLILEQQKNKNITIQYKD